MKQYNTPALTLLSFTREDILTASNSLMLGGINGIEIDDLEIFGGFNQF